METLVRGAMEGVIVAGLVTIAVLVQHLTPAPFWLVGVVLVLAIITAHVLFDHHAQQQEDL